MLTRADCTTRNQRKAERLRRTYDDLEERIARLREEEELASIRPDLDGNQIMEILGIGPGREVGAAYAFLLELRMEEGPAVARAGRGGAAGVVGRAAGLTRWSTHDLEVERAGAERAMSRSQTAAASRCRGRSRAAEVDDVVVAEFSRSETTVTFASRVVAGDEDRRGLAERLGSTISEAVSVLRVLTTLVSGKARWICSPSESVSLTNRVGGKPWEKSSGLEMSTSSLPARLSAPARPSTSRVAAPEEALTTSSAPAAASAKVASTTPG